MTDHERGETGKTGQTGQTGPAGPAGPAGPMGPGGDTGGYGVAGEPGAMGATGGPGQPGVTVAELDEYIRRLEGRYRRISRFLTTALVVTATAGLGTLAWTADGLGDRVDDGRAERSASILEVCEAINAQNRARIEFLRKADPENIELAMETFLEADCAAAARNALP